MCDGIHIIYFCRNERDHENVEVLYLTEREKRKKKTNKKTNKTQFMQSLLYILQITGLQIKKIYQGKDYILLKVWFVVAM